MNLCDVAKTQTVEDAEAPDGIVLKKVDSVTGDVLEGAKFKLAYYYDDGWLIFSDWKWSSGETITLANGELTLKTSGTTPTIKKDMLYRLEEISAPEGYIIDSTPQYFYWYSSSQPTRGSSRVNASGVNYYDIQFVDGSKNKGITIYLANTKKPGDLTLKKSVTGEEVDNNKEFEFTINLTAPANTDLAETYSLLKGPAADTDAVYTRATGNKAATITGIKLKNGETFTVKELPAGTTYTIEESDYSSEGYTLQNASELSGTIVGGSGANKDSSVTAVNNYAVLPKVTGFEFNKIWLPMNARLSNFAASEQQPWPGDAEIIVEITRDNDSDFKLTYRLNGNSNQTEFMPEKFEGTTISADKLTLIRTGDKDYNFKLKEDVLEAVYTEGMEEKEYVYTVKETSSPAEYAATHYGKRDSKNAEDWKYVQDMTNGAGNGEVIINQETGGYELPSTGGPGTRRFTILGGILICLAGVLLWRKKRMV